MIIHKLRMCMLLFNTGISMKDFISKEELWLKILLAKELKRRIYLCLFNICKLIKVQDQDQTSSG